MVLVDLRYGLNKQPPVSYHRKGILHEHGFLSHYTSKDVILKLASTLRAKNTLHTFHLLIVATHSDCVESGLAAQIDDINKELYSLLLPEFENELILFETPGKIAFVMDLKTPGDCDKRALSLICTVVGRSGSGNCFDTPASFFCL